MEARLALRSGAKERAGSLLKRALAAGGGAATDWLGVGEIRLALGDTEGAAAALDSVAAYRSNLLGSPACLRLRSEVLSRLGRDLAALEVFKQYRSIKDSLEMRTRWSNAKYINERHQHELALEKYRGTLMFVFAGIVLLVVVIVGIAIVLKRTKDEQILLNRTEERARLKIKEIRAEVAILKAVSGRNPGESPELRSLIDGRLRLLEECMASVLSSKEDGGSRIDEILDSIKEDRESLRLTFCIIRPRFIERLEERGLTREQINICCLYAIGMSGKEIIATPPRSAPTTSAARFAQSSGSTCTIPTSGSTSGSCSASAAPLCCLPSPAVPAPLRHAWRGVSTEFRRSCAPMPTAHFACCVRFPGTASARGSSGPVLRC